jgi:hypothetical protein
MTLLSPMQFQTPILFLVFNRPEPTRQVFQAIREYQPSHLFVAADGPRPQASGEWRLCAETRAILKEVDWQCEVHTLFRDHNLGCGAAVSEAITWFFDQVEEGIILEDDCLPDSTFFSFCEEMLDRYRHHPEVGTVSGDNFLPRALHMDQPYGFSKYVQIWGWATWRRFWKNYDFKLTGEWAEWEKIVRRANPVQNQANYWLQIFNALRGGLIDTWDYQVMFSSWRHEYVHIFPGRNLITNLGYGGDATHTNFQSPLAHMQRESLKDYQVTLPVTVNPGLDDATFYFRFLESLNSIWWLEQAIDLPSALGWLRSQLTLAQKENGRLQNIQRTQSHEISKILTTRSSSAIRVKYTLLLAHFVYTCRRALDLARTKGNQIIAKIGSRANQTLSRIEYRGWQIISRIGSMLIRKPRSTAVPGEIGDRTAEENSSQPTPGRRSCVSVARTKEPVPTKEPDHALQETPPRPGER